LTEKVADTDDYRFGQIDNDPIQRDHADQVFRKTQLLLAEASGKPEVAGPVSQARDKLAEVDSAYSTMQYGVKQTYRFLNK
jgi:hypothetical protein